MVHSIFYLSLSAGVFTIGSLGLLLNRRSLISQIMALELMLLAASMNFVTFSYYLASDIGQLFVFFILTVAAAESAIGLSILIVLYRKTQSVDLTRLNQLKG